MFLDERIDFIHLGNFKIDYCTLRIMLLCVGPCDIDTLKFDALNFF